MILIVGHARTGTSVLFQCLINSGFNGGNNLFGHKYKTQDLLFNKVRVGLNEQLEDVNSRKYDFKPLWNYCETNNIEVLKDPGFWPLFPLFYRDSERFKKFKFIWTTRVPKDVAESEVRLQKIENVPPVEDNWELTVEERLESYRGYENLIKEYAIKVDSIIVDFDRMLNQTEYVARELSEFLGREIDMGIVSRDETYEATGVPQ